MANTKMDAITPQEEAEPISSGDRRHQAHSPARSAINAATELILPNRC